MFLFKKVASAFIMPLGLSCVLLLIGWFLLFFRRRQRAARIFILAGIFALVLPSLGLFSNMLVQPLERKYPPLDLSAHKAQFVAVLGGGLSDGSGKTAPDLSRASYIRLAEGVRIYRSMPGSKLIVAGGSAFGRVSESEVMAEAARRMGVDGKDIVQENKPVDTESQALLAKPLVGGRSFILVTSAFHMPRAMALFQKDGMEPIPAPVDYFPENSGSPLRFLPHAAAMVKSDAALNEYFGMAWAKLRGRI